MLNPITFPPGHSQLNRQGQLGRQGCAAVLFLFYYRNVGLIVYIKVCIWSKNMYWWFYIYVVLIAYISVCIYIKNMYSWLVSVAMYIVNLLS